MFRPPSLALHALLLGTFLSAVGYAEPSALQKKRGRDEPPPGGNKEELPKAKDPSLCVTHRTEARFISGYDHLVHLTSACEMSVSCRVSTDVNPSPQTVSLAPGETTTVLTYRGSPARTFEATVSCAATQK